MPIYEALRLIAQISRECILRAGVNVSLGYKGSQRFQTASNMQPGTYKKLEIKRFAVRAQRETAEGKYWRAFKAPVVVQQV